VLALQTLFLDAGGVLVFPNWYRVRDTLARHGVDVSADALADADPEAKFRIDQGLHTTSTDARRAWLYMDLVLEGAGVPRTAATGAAVEELRAYHEQHNLWELVPAEVVPALERLAALGLTLVVVSNANGALHRMFDRVGLSRHFHTICDSCVEGVEKPDPRFFDIAIARSGAERKTTMHVGDLYYVDVVGARNSGLHHMLIDPHGLYGGYDAERVRTLAELADRLEDQA
jgi:HAD superfamily hydrolase (TIGR01549 family)